MSRPRGGWAIPPCASSRALADAHSVSVRTAQRWLKGGQVPGAFRAPEGWWVPTKKLKDTA
jgi:hypothetical protein